MIFTDRKHAGALLADALKSKVTADTILIGLPRGGVEVAFVVSQKLNLPLDVICPRKIRAPLSPELALGAVTETGETFLSTDIIKSLGVSETELQSEIEMQQKKAKEQASIYHQFAPAKDLKDKTIVLIDDGLATGATMQAAIITAKAKKTKKIIVAVPVAPFSTLQKFKTIVDEIVCLASPEIFFAVGQFYLSFDQVSDETVLSYLKSQFQKTP